VREIVATLRRGLENLGLTRRRNGTTKSKKKKSVTENEIAKHIIDTAFFLKHGFKRVVNGI
jgi:hypothetical protein